MMRQILSRTNQRTRRFSDLEERGIFWICLYGTIFAKSLIENQILLFLLLLFLTFRLFLLFLLLDSTALHRIISSRVSYKVQQRERSAHLDRLPFQDSGRRSQKTSSRQKRDQKIASLLILIVTVFGCCNLVRILPSKG